MMINIKIRKDSDEEREEQMANDINEIALMLSAILDKLNKLDAKIETDIADALENDYLKNRKEN